MGKDSNNHHDEMTRKVAERERQKIEARKNKGGSIWTGLGMIGTVGWMVALPVLVGILLGAWLEDLIPGRFPWILVLMLAGLATGMITAWIWLMREQKSIHRDREKKHDR